jgi:SNF2 family DNA or RNA helicase
MNLHRYQKRLANFIAKHPRAIISVDMGLGKTAAVLAWMDWYARRKNYAIRGLIIAPKRVAENNWLQEAQKWGLVQLSDRMIICAGTPQKRTKAWNDTAHPIEICSRDNYKDFIGVVADFVVLDELTSYKNSEAKRTQAVASISAPVKIGLTGTFLANGAIDIYGQAIACGLDMHAHNFYAWRGAYFRDILAGAGLAFSKWRLRGTLEELLQPIRENIFTLTAADYLTIPPVTHTTREVPMDEDTRTAINELDAFLCTRLNGEVLTFNENQKFAKLQTLCNGFVYDENGEPKRGERSAKLEAVADFVADCKDAGEPVLLFYAFREEAAWLAELLDARGVKWDSVKKAGFLERWNEHETDCLMAHPGSAGHGLNLQQGGNTIAWFSLPWSLELYTQTVDRLFRQGQKAGTVSVIHIAAKDTIDGRIVRALKDKDDTQSALIDAVKAVLS